MEYTTDPGPIVEQFVADQHATAIAQAANLELDRQMLTFCAELREYAGDDPDPEISKGLEVNEEQLDDCRKRAARYADRMPTKGAKAEADATAAANEARVRWLRDYVAQIEATHAQHQVLADDCEGTPEAEQHLAAMLSIEGAHAAALAELEQLEPKGKTGAKS